MRTLKSSVPSKNRIMELQTERLLIKDLSLDYLDEIHQLHSFPEIDEFNTLGIPETKEITKNIILDWLEKQKTQPRISYVFCITLIETNKFIGLAALNIGKPNYKIAEVWYKTHPDYWKRGYTTEALLEILKFGFEKLKLHRIEAGCAVGNFASIRVLEKVGMTNEGRKREILPIRGKWIDNYFYSILENEFKNLK
jgi:ribosomal-protein-alanine N-acetyltransferase